MTPEAVRNTKFVTTRLRPGYWEEQVDAFLDHVEIEVETLTRERDEAREENARLRAELDRRTA
ncbi:DivIVA domain-containing protein [Actinomadura vinacea]|uniref:DivIVA domain-containing protein n=1 Tax=Actinomadura vinacea TaxID=115336 RepID=UPI003CD06855